MKKTICIDMRNEEQVKWWNNVANKLVRFKWIDTVVETATGKITGYVFAIKGWFARRIVRENKKFDKNSKN